MLNTREFNVYNTMLDKLYNSSDLDKIRKVILDDLTHLVPYDNAAFFLADPITSAFGEPLLYGLDRKLFKQYQDYYEERDEYKKIVFSQDIIPAVDRCSDYMDYQQWQKNEHRSDFLLPQDIYHMACVQVLHGSQLVGEVSLHRKASSPDFSDREMLILHMLHCHINNVFTGLPSISLECRLQVEGNHSAAAVCLFDSSFRMVSSNLQDKDLLSSKLINGKDVYHHLKHLCFTMLNDPENKSSSQTNHIFSSEMLLNEERLSCNIVLLNDEFRPNKQYFLAAISTESRCKIQESSSDKSLTRREKDVVALIAQGKSNKEIAQQLYISENTVKTHIKRLFSKLGVKSRSELVFNVYY